MAPVGFGHPFLAVKSGAEGLLESPFGYVQLTCHLKEGHDPFQITESESGENCNAYFHFYYYQN